MVRLWDERRGIKSQRHPARARPPDPNDEPITPSRPKLTRPALQLAEVPRRAVRLSPVGVSPLLEYIFEHFEASVNSHNGFPLQRAALDKNYELAEWLLRRGADPGLRDSLAVVAAIERKDLRMVKLLVEPFEGSTSSGKRRRLADRVVIGPYLVEKALTSGTNDIVDYFVHEKGEQQVQAEADRRCNAAIRLHHGLDRPRRPIARRRFTEHTSLVQCIELTRLWSYRALNRFPQEPKWGYQQHNTLRSLDPASTAPRPSSQAWSTTTSRIASA